LKIASSLEIITVREQAGLSAAIEIISTQKGKRIMDDIRKVSYNMDQLEENSLIARNKTVDSYFLAQLYVVLGGIISILIATFLMIINNQSLKLKKNLLKSEKY
jgi:CHASE3 domain sensor protein